MEAFGSPYVGALAGYEHNQAICLFINTIVPPDQFCTGSSGERYAPGTWRPLVSSMHLFPEQGLLSGSLEISQPRDDLNTLLL